MDGCVRGWIGEYLGYGWMEDEMDCQIIKKYECMRRWMYVIIE